MHLFHFLLPLCLLADSAPTDAPALLDWLKPIIQGSPVAAVLLWSVMQFLAQHRTDMENLRQDSRGVETKIDGIQKDVSDIKTLAQTGSICRTPNPKSQGA